MDWLLSTVGAVVVLVALWDVFHTLWHPKGFGRLARCIFGLAWWTTARVLPRHTRRLAGPIAIVGTVGLWTVMLVVGWALVYLPHVPHGFAFSSSLQPERSSDLVIALYLSFVTLTTLGFGDVTPTDPVLRMLVPVEALLGFVLLTAAISWVLQVYPALGRRRTVAHHLMLTGSRRSLGLVESGSASFAGRTLEGATDGIVQVETDLLQYSESYYFLEEDRRRSLAVALPHALELVDAGRRSPAPEVRLAADVLADAVDSLARLLDEAYLHTEGTTSDVLAAYADDHRIDSSPDA